MNLFLQGGSKVGGKYDKCDKIFEREKIDRQKSSCFGCLENAKNISKNY